MERAPNVEKVFFPLDEELGLLPSNLAPRQQEHLVHLACFMPFDKVAEMMDALLSVQTHEETVRRLTEQVGSWMEAAQTAEVEADGKSESEDEEPLQRCVFSSDGAMVSLVKKQWVETRTVAIGEPQEKLNAEGETEIHVGHLSYFSQLADASTFTDLAEVEMRRRKVAEAKQVCAVMDGADWLQTFTERHRPDALRILDFPHAAEHITKLLEALEKAGMRFPPQMLDRCLHILKHRGPRPLLRMAARLESGLAQQKGVYEHLDYLRKREALMQYPVFRQQGWPIGSGMVESANKNIVEARLKGTGMHWERDNVNPMLALRNAVCNDRWREMWQKALRQHRRQQALQRSVRAEQRAQAFFAVDDASSLQSPPPVLAATLPGPSRPSLRRKREPHRHTVSARVKCSPARSSAGRAEACLCCGTPFVQSGGRTKRYCSSRCRVRAYHQRQANAKPPSSPDDPTLQRVKAPPARSSEARAEACLCCGTPLVQSGGRTKRYCSDRCRVRAYHQRQAKMGRNQRISRSMHCQHRLRRVCRQVKSYRKRG